MSEYRIPPGNPPDAQQLHLVWQHIDGCLAKPRAK